MLLVDSLLDGRVELSKHLRGIGWIGERLPLRIHTHLRLSLRLTLSGLLLLLLPFEGMVLLHILHHCSRYGGQLCICLGMLLATLRRIVDHVPQLRYEHLLLGLLVFSQMGQLLDLLRSDERALSSRSGLLRPVLYAIVGHVGSEEYERAGACSEGVTSSGEQRVTDLVGFRPYTGSAGTSSEGRGGAVLSLWGLGIERGFSRSR